MAPVCYSDSDPSSLTWVEDKREPFIEANDLETFWWAMAKISTDNVFNEPRNVTINVENIKIGDKTYKGPVVLNPDDIAKKNMRKLLP